MKKTASNGAYRAARNTAGAKPAHGTGEWAAHNVNIQSGCRNGCLYCYAQCMAVRFKRKMAGNWTEPEICHGKVAMRYGRKNGRIMFPTSHDIDERNIDACLTVIGKMLAAGNEILIVSKPRLGCIRRLCEELTAHKTQITLRFTIGSADDAVLQAWEPNAPSFGERLASLRHAFEAGYRTSVSCEPMLDARIDVVVEAARPFVTDSIWLGKANQLRQIVAINRPRDARAKAMADALLNVMTDKFVRELHRRYRDDRLIRFKDSIKKVVGIERPTTKGLDI